MSLHKLTAGDGYSYLTRQVAAHDSTEKGHTGLGDYYSQKGESPGVWLGSGLAGLDGVAEGDQVTADQMKALFGEGRHPDAAAIEAVAIAAGAGMRDVLRASMLGQAFPIYDGASTFQIEVARRFNTYNTDRGDKWNAPIPSEERARVRTELGRSMFAQEFGREAGDARELSGFIARASRQATTAVAGYDLTFSPVKSVSALWAVAPREVAEQVEAAHNAAIKSAISYLETDATYTRQGRGGVRQVEVTGIIAAGFTHRDSRAGDPDLHTHVAVSNKVQTRDGRWLALDGRVLYKATVSASEHYNTALEAELVARIGVTFTDRPEADARRRPVREIIGVDPRLTELWSRRRAVIDVRRGQLTTQFQADHGRPPTDVEALHLAQQATLDTRDAKHEPRSFAEQRHTWHEQALGVLGGQPGLRRMLAATIGNGTRWQSVTEEWVTTTAAEALSIVSSSRATWQVWHVRAEAQRRARAAGVALFDLPDAVSRVVCEALAPGNAMALGPQDTVDEPEPLRRSDGTSVYTVAGAQLYTTPVIVDAERRLVAAAHRHDGRRLTDAQIETGLLEQDANGVTLNDLQAQLVRELATSGARVQLAIAPAGSGKTTAMRALATTWTANCGTIIGLAPSATAAAVLSAEIGGHTDTLAKLTHSLASGVMPEWVRTINETTLVIIDEAGMAGTADLAQAVDYILGRGGSVRLIGDDQQLASIAAGGVLRDIADTAGAVTLSHLMRFSDPAEGAATLALRTGDPAGVGFYLDHHRVHVGDETTVADHAYRAWAADRAAGLDAVMLAPTRDLLATLNIRARADRLAATTGPTGPEVHLSDGNPASAGDTIVSRHNDRTLVLTATDWVKNGDRWTIITVRRDGAVDVTHHGTGRRITLPAGYVKAHAELGYASTVHGAQGITADTCHTVATGGENRQLLYVALTRGRAANHLYLVTASDGDEHTVTTPQSLFPPTASDILTGILARDGSQRSASSLDRDLADPAVLLHDAVGRYHDAVGVAAEHVLGGQRMAAIDAAAERRRDGLTESTAYPTLRAHLALLAVDGRDPITTLEAAVAARELGSALDPAAVLDWRLHPASTRQSTPGPLPWLPAVPAALRNDAQWGDYLTARAQRVTDLADQVTRQSDGYAPTTAPAWAARLLDPVHDPLRAELAVWRAACGVPDHDHRPTGAAHLASAAAGYQHDLDTRAAVVLGDPTHDTRTWAAVVDRLDHRISGDDYWPQLAARLAALDRAGIDVARMLTTAATERALPDEQPAAALWWRMSRHLSPASVSATARSGADALRPAWTPALTGILGANRAERVLADPSWPALVAAVNTAITRGWQPGDVLHAAAELAHLDQTTAANTHSADVATALVWRVAMLADPSPFELGDPMPTDPSDDEHTPPAHYVDIDSAGRFVDDERPFGPDDSRRPPTDPDHARPSSTDDDVDALDPVKVIAPRLPRVSYADVRRDALVAANDHLETATEEDTKPATAPVARERLVELNQQTQDFLTSRYPRSWAAQTLRVRVGTDLTGDARFTPGYAPVGFDQLTRHLRGLGATGDEMIAAGLSTLAANGRVIDRFRDRLMFPIHGPTGSDGEIHGFIGRRNPATADDDPFAGPKYLNTADTDLFSKGAQLFGLHEGRAALAAGAVPVLVEGPLDAIAVTLATAGTHVGVAPLGTAFTHRQADQLRPYIGPDRPGITVATDADRAGQQAAERAYWQLTARGDNPAHVTLAAGYDPAQLLEHHGPAAVRAALHDTQPLATTLTTQAVDRYDTGTAEGVVGATRAAAEIIGALPPDHWLDHITAVNAQLDATPGAVHLAVIDAGTAWTDTPRGRADQHIADISRPATTAEVRANAGGADPYPRSSPVATETTLPVERPTSDLRYRLVSDAPAAGTRTSTGADGNSVRASHVATSAQLGVADNTVSDSDSTATDRSHTEPRRPDGRWLALVDSIDPRLAAGDDWPALATTLDRVDAAGLDVAAHVARVAQADELPETHPAIELQYRLIDALDLQVSADPGLPHWSHPAPRQGLDPVPAPDRDRRRGQGPTP